METLFDILKTAGSFLGIFASAFLIWDRYFKDFPVAIIVARPLMPGSAQIVPSLLLKNVSDRPVLVSWNRGDPTQLRIAKADSGHEVALSTFKGETMVSLGPASEAYFAVLRPRGYDEINPENPLEIELRWKFAQPRIWKVERRVLVWIRKRDFDSMLDGHIEPSDDD
jgi:hypothetical protein